MNSQTALADLRPTSLGRVPFSSVPDVKKLRFPADDAGQRFPFVDGKYPAQEIREAYRVHFHDAAPFDPEVEDPTSWVFEVEMDNDDEVYGPVGPVGHVTLLFDVLDPEHEDSLPDGVQDALYRQGGAGREFVDNYRAYWRAKKAAAEKVPEKAPEEEAAAQVEPQEQQEPGTPAPVVHPPEIRQCRATRAADMSVGRWLQQQHGFGVLTLEDLGHHLTQELHRVDEERRISALIFEEMTPQRWRLALHCREPAELGRSLTSHSVTITPALFGDCHMKVTGRRKYEHQRQTLEFIEATLKACLWQVASEQ